MVSHKRPSWKSPEEPSQKSKIDLFKKDTFVGLKFKIYNFFEKLFYGFLINVLVFSPYIFLVFLVNSIMKYFLQISRPFVYLQ